MRQSVGAMGLGPMNRGDYFPPTVGNPHIRRTDLGYKWIFNCRRPNQHIVKGWLYSQFAIVPTSATWMLRYLLVPVGVWFSVSSLLHQ